MIHLNFHLLRAFFAVASHESFSRAAEAIHVSQPAVSRAVKELEEQLELKLVERQGSRVGLTQAGSALYGHAKSIFALERVALADLRGRKSLEHGTLTIGASRTVATYMMPRLIAQFMELYPGLQIRVVSDNTRAIEQYLLECELDLAFVEGAVTHPQIKLTHWREDELIIIAAADHPLFESDHFEPAALSEQLWIAREVGSGTREITEALLRQAHIVPKEILEVGNNGAVVQSVAASQGLAMISLEAARDQLALGKVRIIHLSGKVPFVRPIFYARLIKIPPNPAVRALEAMAL